MIILNDGECTQSMHMMEDTVSTTIPFKEGISPNVSGEMTQRVRGAHTRFARHGAHSQMTGAVRFPEQLCLMTDGGR